MKRLGLLAAVLAIAASCSVNETELEFVKAPNMFGYTEGEQATKTAITVDGEGVGTILWKPADNINVFFGTTSVRYYSTNEVDATTVVFETSAMLGSTESASDNKWGLYPYDDSASCDGSSITTTIPDNQQCVPETFGNNLFPMIAHTSSNELHFKNVCGGIKFSLSRDDIQSITFRGNDNEDIVGQVQLTFDGEDNPVASVVAGEKTITLTPSTGATFASGTNYYIVMLPTVLPGGFTMTFETETEIGTFEYTAKAIEIKRSIFAKKANIDTFASFSTTPIDLSTDGTANCYIVSDAGDYKFRTVQGNSLTSVGAVAAAEVLWESFGTNEIPSVGDLVNTVSVEGEYIRFSASDIKGNAVIAAKDASNNILWSWHIWLTDQPVDQIYNNDAGTMMDRNLGAISATPGDVQALGLMYQWGRKDPFLGSRSISSDTSDSSCATSTITWPDYKDSYSYGTIEYVTSHPTTFVTENAYNYDWYYTANSITDNTRWQTSDKEKGLYDPCPRGYRVPDGGPNGIWAKAFGKSSGITAYPNKDNVHKGMDFGINNALGSGTIWYPLAGYYSRNRVSYVGDSGYYWSCSPYDYRNRYEEAHDFEFNSYGNAVSPSYTNHRGNAMSIRCAKQIE